MRVTQSMLANNTLRHISESYGRMAKTQEQLSTGKKISRPSDDPVVAMKGMTYRTNLTEVEQYKRNLSEAYNWMENSDAALDKATSVMQRIRELTVQASNGTLEDSQREIIAKEVGQLKEHLVSIANTQVAGKFIFNGNDTTAKPVDLNASKVSTNGNPVELELSKGIKIAVNIDPRNVFTLTPDGLFGDITALENTLNSTNPANVDSFLGKLDKHINNLVSERAELGARYNRVELIDERVSEQEVIANRILSDNEDADIERVITDLKMQETVHRAALGVGSRIMQPTLMDFLR
ncbi:flagellar hook-associated protein FlgL [Fictibacillus barbaricus]|uniref:Flagellar hook-associated protein FlgL n=1 Tax=Fictibacillus barbaricus TaxID=182136 RepID=A0ABS2ZF04_9BACL|nr:flagellar hook-associated protein FlgL [Fictibacillus barbaricus]MBN3546768.1 flagellar hook-associated protein FlgL [Fictibacillus barbaricus]GGB43682.1 flagellar hook-associated protein 3 [Fictibacillus barbaricus]